MAWGIASFDNANKVYYALRKLKKGQLERMREKTLRKKLAILKRGQREGARKAGSLFAPDFFNEIHLIVNELKRRHPKMLESTRIKLASWGS